MVSETYRSGVRTTDSRVVQVVDSHNGGKSPLSTLKTKWNESSNQSGVSPEASSLQTLPESLVQLCRAMWPKVHPPPASPAGKLTWRREVCLYRSNSDLANRQ